MPAVPCGEAAEFLLSVLREELTGETFPMDEGMSEAVVSKMLTLAKPRYISMMPKAKN